VTHPKRQKLISSTRGQEYEMRIISVQIFYTTRKII